MSNKTIHPTIANMTGKQGDKIRNSKAKRAQNIKQEAGGSVIKDFFRSRPIPNKKKNIQVIQHHLPFLAVCCVSILGSKKPGPGKGKGIKIREDQRPNILGRCNNPDGHRSPRATRRKII